MLEVSISAILFSILLIYEYAKNKRVTIGILVISFYLLINIVGIIIIDGFNLNYNYSILASIYLFIICLIFFQPVLQLNSIIQRGFVVQKSNIFKIIIGLYLFLALILTISNVQIINRLLIDGNYAQLKRLAYDGELGTDQRFIFKLARVYVSSLSAAVLLYGFYIAKNPRTPYYISVLYILAGVVPTFVTNMLYTYRGGMGVQVLLIISCYIFMRRYYSKKRKIQFYITFATIFIIFITYMISITYSRFGEATAGDSFIDYLGQSMLNFNGGVANRIDAYANGKYFFGPYFGLSIDQVCVDSLYGIISKDGGNLHTFVGNLVIDFGFLGGFLVACLISILLCKCLCNKKRYDFADSALLMFYLDFIYSGAFHSSFGFSKTCLYFMVIYVFLKILSKNKIYGN